MKQPCVHMLASGWNGTLYIGVTSDLVARIHQHRNDIVPGFTSKYGVHVLVWFEQQEAMESAITREKAIKRWKREWKIRLIEATNPKWIDLYPTVVGCVWRGRTG